MSGFEEERAAAKARLADLIKPRPVDHDASRDQRLRNRIEATKAAARRGTAVDVTGELRELSREHYRITGAGGGA